MTTAYPNMPDAKTMRDIIAAVQGKTGAYPSKDEVAAALDAVMAERLQDVLALADMLKSNPEPYVDYLAGSLSPMIQLQGIGWVRAKPANELRIGDTTVWNYGYKDVVMDIEQTSKAFITVYLLPPYADKYAQPQPRRLKRTRLIAITN